MRLAVAVVLFCVGCRGGFDIAPDAAGSDVTADSGPTPITVQRGNAILPLGMTSINVAIATVDIAHAMLVFEVSTSSLDPGPSLVMGTLSAANLSFARQASGPTETISWQVIELPTLIDVQRGTVTSPNAGTASTVVTIASVDLNASFVITSWNNSGTNFDEDDYARVRLTSPSTLEVQCGVPAGGGGFPNELAYQVVSLHDGSVMYGDTSFPAGVAEQSIPLTLDPQHAFPTLSWYSDDDTGDTGSLALRAAVSSTELHVMRGLAALPVVAAWSVVTFPSATIQHGTTSLAATSSTASAPITAVDLARSFVLVDGATTSYSGVTPDDQAGIFWVRADLGPTIVSFARDTTTAASDVAWSVVSF